MSESLRWEISGRYYQVTACGDHALANPVLSARMYSRDRPPDEVLIPFTEAAVSELLAAVRIQDPVGWTTRNVAAALRLTGRSVAAWRGIEMALDHDDPTGTSVWSEPGAARVQLLWLALVLDAGATVPVSIYQDDELFGLQFVDHGGDPSGSPSPGYRTRDDLPMPVGEIEQVAVSLERTGAAAILADVRLTIGGKTCALVAAEYVDGGWRRLDESVVAVPDAGVLERLDWVPPIES